jgi:hypothetical protein
LRNSKEPDAQFAGQENLIARSGARPSTALSPSRHGVGERSSAFDVIVEHAVTCAGWGKEHHVTGTRTPKGQSARLFEAGSDVNSIT